MIDLYYGQIRPTNYEALLALYGHFPPWPMSKSPHVDLVRALLDGRPPEKTAFADYLHLTGRPELLADRVTALEAMIIGKVPLQADVCCNCILDGNHRTAVAIATGRALELHDHPPYQAVETPLRKIEGRRFPRAPLPYDFTGKTVLDLGANAGMTSVQALRAGAVWAILVDHDLTSLTWQVLDECGFGSQAEVMPLDARDLGIEVYQATDVVLALSAVRHIGLECLRRVAAGKDVLLETHDEGELPPDTGHRWEHLTDSVYSVAEPDRRRRVYLGRP